jgi:hypothetical protein
VLRRHLEVPSGVVDMAEGNEIRWWHNQTQRCGRRKREMTSGAHMVVTGARKDVTAEMHKPEEKAPFW